MRRLALDFLRLAPVLALMGLAACDEDPVGPDREELPELSCAGGIAVVADGEEIPVAPNGFAAVGNRIVSVATCEPFRFVGVSRPSFSFTPDGNRLGVDTTAAADFARIRGWGANTVRIELAQYFWLPSSRFYDPRYAERVDRAVRLAREAGLYVILALQTSDRGDPNYPGDPYSTNMHQPMPDVNHSVPFWRDLAARYKDDGGVLYELYSEPYPLGGAQGFSDWNMWLNGGLHRADEVYDELRAPFQAVGMQRLYEVVRETGAHNLVILGGTSWGYFLDGVPTHRVKGYNIAYATHPWDFPPDKQPATFEKDWAFLARTDPVMITEFGNYDCTEGYARAVLDAADEHELSWIAWAWTAPRPGESQSQAGRGDPICEFPMLLTDWSGTPSRIGQIIKSRLASY
jgi:endoglucanase